MMLSSNVYITSLICQKRMKALSMLIISLFSALSRWSNDNVTIIYITRGLGV